MIKTSIYDPYPLSINNPLKAQYQLINALLRKTFFLDGVVFQKLCHTYTLILIRIAKCNLFEMIASTNDLF